MEQYIGLDVSLKEMHICVVDGSGAVVSRGRKVTHPEHVAAGRLGGGRLCGGDRRCAPVCRRLMGVPGVGRITTLAFVTAVDDLHRFARSAWVGAYLGLTPRRHQSGQVNWSGRISKHGDGLARHMLCEAANSLLSRVRRGTAPKTWAARLVNKVGPKNARVALARKLAVILHHSWIDASGFRWTKEVTA